MARLSKKRIPEICRILEETHGVIADAADVLNVKRQALSNFVHNYDQTKESLIEARERINDVAVNGLHAAIIRGESWAIQFQLKTQGKDRGYTERQEQTGTHGGPIVYEVVEKEWKQEEPSKSNGPTNANVNLLHLRRNGKSSGPDGAAGKRSA